MTTKEALDKVTAIAYERLIELNSQVSDDMPEDTQKALEYEHKELHEAVTIVKKCVSNFMDDYGE